MSAEGNFEKTRIQDRDKAHEDANMLKAQAEARGEDYGETFRRGKESLTAKDYDEALAVLEELRGEVLPTPIENVVRPLRDVAMAIGALSESAQDLLAWSLLSVIPGLKDDMAGEKLPKERLVEVLKGIKLRKDYNEYKIAIATAREKLERRRAEAEEIAKR